MKLFPIDPDIANLLDRLAANLQQEIQQRLEMLEFQADYPHPLQECIDLVETLRRNLLNQERR
jgi:hypothetical protein